MNAPQDDDLPFAAVASASRAVAGASGRKAKVVALADLLTRTPDRLVPAVVAWLSGSLRQRRTGLGWAALREVIEGPFDERRGPALSSSDVDAFFTAAADTSGPGSSGARRQQLVDLFARGDADERALLTGLLAGQTGTGAGSGLVLEAVVATCGAPPDVVRRAVMLLGDPASALLVARAGGADALSAVGLRVGVPVAPMLAASAPTVQQALEATGPAGVEWKLDGIRAQVHRDGTGVRVFTRSLDEITHRLPDVVAAVTALPGGPLVLDGEVLALDEDGVPLPFQVSSSRAARADRDPDAEPLTLMAFDVLHADGVDLWDRDGPARRAALDAVIGQGRAGVRAVPRLEVDPASADDLAAAEEFAGAASRARHEGVVVKAHSATYAMGRRGVGWVKVKPRLTLDLLVVAAEWGHGRRTGSLSNLHLAARDPEGRFGPAGGTVMLGKTFKGLTDATLRWQTEELSARAVSRASWGVRVRPDLVVEIALDGLQTSPRYPAAVALRFARVVRYRPDKAAEEADTIDTVLALHEGSG